MKLAIAIAIAAVVLALAGGGAGFLPAALLCGAAGIAVGVQMNEARHRPTLPVHDDGRISRAFLWLVALVYAASWFLPAISADAQTESNPSPGSMPLMGWQAFAVAVGPLFSTRAADGYAIQFLFWVATALTNVAFLWALLYFFVRPAAPTGRWVIGLLAAAALNTYWLLDSEFRPGLLAGYFVWLCSFVVLAAVLRVRIDPSPRPRSVKSLVQTHPVRST